MNYNINIMCQKLSAEFEIIATSKTATSQIQSGDYRTEALRFNYQCVHFEN